ncbi:Protein of unknown function [Bacillus mycoides]|nr:Protein of unknown function [Bacillus mycoides]
MRNTVYFLNQERKGYN